MKNFNKISFIFALIISAFILFVSTPLWISKQVVNIKLSTTGDFSDVSVNYGGKTANLLQKKDNAYYFYVAKYLSSNSLKIYFKDVKSKVEISTLNVNHSSIFQHELSKLIVSGGKYELENNKLILAPSSGEIILSCPVSATLKLMFKPIMFIIIFSVIFFSSYLLLSGYEAFLQGILLKLKENYISENVNKVFFSIFLFFTTFFSTIFLFSFLGFIVNFPIQKWYSIVALFVAIVSQVFYNKKSELARREVVFQCGLIFVSILISGLLSQIFWDYSWDGRNYHQEAIILLSSGWNPVFELPKFSLFNPTLWIEHYPKFAEILSSNFILLFNNIEFGKIINYLFSFSTFCLAFYTFNKFKGSNILYNLIFAILVILNPVSICQVGSFCVDLLVYYMFVNILLLFALKEISEINNKLFIFLTIATVVMLSNVKLGGLLYALVLLMGYFLYSLINKKFESLKSTLVISGLSAILVLLSGINPYFTNIKQGHNPFYPILGEEKLDIITFHAPKTFENKNSLEKLFISLFSNTEHTHFFVDKETSFKIPFSVQNQTVFNVSDMRIAGFGYLFGGILILIVFFTFFTEFPKTSENKTLYFIMNLTFLTVFLNPEAWWARYVPQLWLIPIFIIFWKGLTTNKSFQMKLFINVLIVLLFLNSLIIEYQNVKTRLDFTASRKEFLAQLKNKNVEVFEDGEIISEQNLYYRFSKQNTTYKKVSKDYYLKNQAKFDNIPNYLEENLKWNVFSD